MCSLNFVCESSGYYKLCAFINWRSSKLSSINPFSQFLSHHSHCYSSKTEEKHQATVSVRGVCMHFPFLSLWPSSCSLFFFPLASDQTVPVVFYTVFFFLCEFAIKISRHITSCWCFHHFQYWIELLKNTHEKCFNDFFMRKRVAVKYCIYMFLCSWCYFVFFPAWTHILWALENHVELYFRQVLSWADCSSGQRSVALLRTALFLKGVGFDYLSHTETRRIRQHVLSSAHSQEAQLELATRWKILLINGCSNGLQFSGVQWILAI